MSVDANELRDWLFLPPTATRHLFRSDSLHRLPLQNDSFQRSRLVEAGDKIKWLINASNHLVCASCEVRAPHEISLEEVEDYIRWDSYDYLSFGEDD